MNYIDIELIHPHPKNPRENVGDVSELAESIKENGIMQNLTVNDNEDGTYTVIIGHRRLAASKLAGLAKVPCQVVYMDATTQQSIMLLENMQRIDLTPYEQAQGFQMCLELGLTEDDLKTKTGFSKKTIRHRLKLLDLDKEKFKKGVERGGTLQDYIDLEQVKDHSKVNTLLEAIGTPNFRYLLNMALTKQKRDEATEELISNLSEFMEQVQEFPANYEYICYLYNADAMKNYQIPDDINHRGYVFTVRNGAIEIYREKNQEVKLEVVENPKELTQEDIAIEQIKSKVEAAFNTRLEFAKEIYSSLIFDMKKNTEIRYAFALLTDSIEFCGSNDEVFHDVTGKELEDIQAKEYPEFASFKVSTRLLFALIYANLENSSNTITVINWKYGDYGAYNDNYKNEIKELYDFLEEYGYQPSEEEKAIMFGTHELYVKNNEGE